MKQASRDLALCGVLCALAVAIMAMGTILPVATYCAPVLASMTLLPVLVLCGEKLSWAMFFASAMLSLLLAPDKEAAAIFLALGYYPIVKPKLDQKPKIRRWVGKFLLFNVSILAVYAVLLFVLRLDALREAHFPTNFDRLAQAKERLAYEELLLFQAGVAGAAGERRRAQPLEIQDAWIEEFFDKLPFAPTNAQRRVAGEVAADMRGDRAMARMVQGDVGCGKTLIALCAMYLCVRAGGQAALMAPTEILASQHLQSAVQTLAPLGVTCGLLTGRMTAAEKRRAKEAIAAGAWQAVIGTHALISEGVEFANLRLTITDEQHRFGVRQRTTLEGKGDAPHVMVMSATPIPRTLSLVLYGDLDLSAVDEMPPGRTPVRTRIVPEEKRGYRKKPAAAENAEQAADEANLPPEPAAAPDTETTKTAKKPAAKKTAAKKPAAKKTASAKTAATKKTAAKKAKNTAAEDAGEAPKKSASRRKKKEDAT